MSLHIDKQERKKGILGGDRAVLSAAITYPICAYRICAYIAHAITSI